MKKNSNTIGRYFPTILGSTIKETNKIMRRGYDYRHAKPSIPNTCKIEYLIESIPAYRHPKQLPPEYIPLEVIPPNTP